MRKTSDSASQRISFATAPNELPDFTDTPPPELIDPPLPDAEPPLRETEPALPKECVDPPSPPSPNDPQAPASYDPNSI